MAGKLYKYKNKLKRYKKKLKKIKIVSQVNFRDLLIVFAVVISGWIIGALVGIGIFTAFNKYNKSEINKFPDLTWQRKTIPQNIPKPVVINMDNWKTYRSQKYEFEIKYPKEWAVPKEEYSANQQAGYEYKVSFKSFNILIRDDLKLSSSSNQKCNNKENNTPKYILASYQNNYADLSETPAENNSCAIKEIRILKNDFYFKKVFVYHIVKGKYSYDIVPTEENENNAINYVSASAVNEVSPELSEVLSTFKFKSADPVLVKSEAVSVGRISCGNKNDHPSRSKTRGKHMDEDCCPDPDEWPKPGCIYSPAGRALMLSGPK